MITYGVPFEPTTQRRVFVVQVATVSSSGHVSRQHVQQSFIKAIGWILLCSPSQTTPPRLVPNLYHTKFPAPSLLLAMPTEEERDYALV
jgi:hypothetical protein